MSMLSFNHSNPYNKSFSTYTKRVSFNNLAPETIDPEHPRYLPKFISEEEEYKKETKKKQHLDLDFGYSVQKSSSIASSDPAKFFKFNDFNFINENDRNYNSLKSQQNFSNETKRQKKLKSEKLPTISKEKSILKKRSDESSPSSSDYNFLRSKNGSNLKKNLNAYNTHPESFSNVSNRFQNEDQDEETIRNTQMNINLNPQILQEVLFHDKNFKTSNKKKKLTEMTDEEILALDEQFSKGKYNDSDMTSSILNGLESSIEFSKFNAFKSSLEDEHRHPQDVKTKYSKEGVNITNIFHKTYQTRPVVNYKSYVLHCQHKEYDDIRNYNLNLTYPPKSLIKSFDPNFHLSYIGNYQLLNNFNEVPELDPFLTPNKTLMCYISGRKHTWSSLEYLFNLNEDEVKDKNHLIKDGDHLIVFSVLPYDFELLEEFFTNDNKSEKSDNNNLTRYKTTSMLDDLNDFNQKKQRNSKTESSSSNSSRPPMKKGRSQSSVDYEIKRITSNHPSANFVETVFEKYSSEERQKLLTEKISKLSNNLLELVEKMAVKNDLKIKITVEICFDNVLHENLDNNESENDETRRSFSESHHSHKKKKLNLKFVLTNIISVYSPNIFIIGSKANNYDFLNSKFHHNEILQSLNETLVNNSGISNPTSGSSSRRQSLTEEIAEKPSFSNSPSTSSLTSSCNNNNNNDLHKTHTNSRNLSRVNTNTSAEEHLGLWKSSTNNSYYALSKTLSNKNGFKKKVKVSEFMINNTNLPVLVIPNDELHILKKKSFHKKRRVINDLQNSSWMDDWNKKLSDFDEEEDNEDEDEDFSGSDSEDFLVSKIKKVVSTKSNHSFEELVTTNKNNTVNIINNTIPRTIPETFFKELLAGISDKSINESLNYLDNSQIPNPEKSLPLTSRTKKMLNRRYSKNEGNWKPEFKSKLSNSQTVSETNSYSNESDSEQSSDSDSDIEENDKPYYPKDYEPKIHFAPIKHPQQLSKAATNSSGLTYQDILKKTRSQQSSMVAGRSGSSSPSGQASVNLSATSSVNTNNNSIITNATQKKKKKGFFSKLFKK